MDNLGFYQTLINKTYKYFLTIITHHVIVVTIANNQVDD